MAEDLVGDEEMPDVRAAEALACGAIAAVVEWPLVRAILRPFDVESTVLGKRRAVAPHTSGRHAIEEVHATSHAFDEILRKSDAHEIAGTVRGQRVVDDLENPIHVVLGLTNGE